MRPVVAIYSTFLQRAYDQIVHDVCIQNLPVVFALDRAGLVGDDGKTHQGIFDLTYLRCLPNMKILAPANENELQRMMVTAFAHEDGPIAVRFPRGNGTGVPLDADPRPLPIGKGEVVREGTDIALIAAGTILSVATEAAEQLAAEGIQAMVINARSVKPLDEDLILEAARRCGRVITIEESVVKGGFGAGVLELFAREGLLVPTVQMGVPDEMIPHGSQGKQREWCGLTAERMVAHARKLLGRESTVAAEEHDLIGRHD
jgi:1-deoxy-D-xylulose-5-phosphate synthase